MPGNPQTAKRPSSKRHNRGVSITMSNKARIVRPEDFKNQACLSGLPSWFVYALENGEIEWRPKLHSEDEIRQRVFDELMKFVEPIRQYATDEWVEANRIDRLWENIFESRRFRDSFVVKKGNNKGHLCLYRAVGLIIYLCNKNVYWTDKGTIKLALLPSAVMNNVWKNATSPSYALEDEDKKIVEKLIKNR